MALDASRIMLTWHDVSAEVGYRIHEGDSLVATVAADVTSYTVTGLAPNTYKCHAIQAFNSAGASPASAQACTTTTRSCGSHDQCRSNDVCQLGLCANGLCDVSPITCRVRTLVVIPSDVGNLPNDATVRNRTDAALNTISTYFETKLGSPLRYDPALILHAPFDSAWFSATAPLRDPHLPEPSIPRPVDEPWDHYDTALGVARERGASAAEARPAIDLGRMATYLANEGHGICDDGWLTQIVAATTLGGGFAGANICGSPLRLTANSGPADGPGYAGFSMVSQWVLEVILTGETSASCQEEMGNDYWACPAQVGLGTIVHELGHALGLPHPCDGWYRDHWEYTSSVCNGLIMQSHWNYPTAGFSANEQAILQLNPTLGSSSATLIAPAEQRAFATPAREKQRRRQRSQRRDSSE